MLRAFGARKTISYRLTVSVRITSVARTGCPASANRPAVAARPRRHDARWIMCGNDRREVCLGAGKAMRVSIPALPVIGFDRLSLARPVCDLPLPRRTRWAILPPKLSRIRRMLHNISFAG